MSNTISYKLKKRTFADTVISCVICVAALAASVWQFVCFLNGEGKPFITNAVYNFIIFAELGLLSLILLEIRKTGKPFSKKDNHKAPYHGCYTFYRRSYAELYRNRR